MRWGRGGGPGSLPRRVVSLRAVPPSRHFLAARPIGGVRSGSCFRRSNPVRFLNTLTGYAMAGLIEAQMAILAAALLSCLDRPGEWRARVGT